MARKKSVEFSQQEVDYVASSVMANCLRNTSLALLGSNAPPSGEVGRILMHLSNGANEHNEAASKLRDILYGKAVNEAAADNSEAEERLQLLEQIIDGKAK